MSEQKKEIPPTEVSLKYMAWNIKEISENIKKMTEILSVFVQKTPPSDNMPF